ncbi:MAG: sigma-70 family RNA polymerase sigma factor [Dehalococcoidia bacterium]
MRAVNKTSSTENVNPLVEKAIGGDAESFGRLYDIFINKVYQYVYYRVSNKEDTEDITQQVFIKAWKAINKYKITSKPFIAWLLRISRNLIIDFYRSKKAMVYINSEFEIPGAEKSPEHLAESEYDQRVLRNIIQKLPYEQQQVIMMKFIEGYTYSEISASLNKSEGAVRVIQHRALKKMQGILEEEKQSR